MDHLAARLDVKADQLKHRVEGFYASLNTYLQGSELESFVQFFNWGYEPVPGHPDAVSEDLPAGMMDRQAIRLILELLGPTSPDNADILDVGCGRGGTLATLAERFKPRSLTGIDLTRMSIEHCRRVHNDPRLRFYEGDAEQLQFGDNSFDLITNVESSNAYPNIGKFYGEVVRLLRVGGHFAYTDLLQPSQFDEARQFFLHNGFELEEERDITRNVLAARRSAANTQLRAFNAATASPDDDPQQSLMDYFLAPEGSDFFTKIDDGLFAYKIQRFRKITNHDPLAALI